MTARVSTNVSAETTSGLGFAVFYISTNTPPRQLNRVGRYLAIYLNTYGYLAYILMIHAANT